MNCQLYAHITQIEGIDPGLNKLRNIRIQGVFVFYFLTLLLICYLQGKINKHLLTSARDV